LESYPLIDISSEQNRVTFGQPPEDWALLLLAFMSICRTFCAIPRRGAGSTLAQWPFLLLLLNMAGWCSLN